jgi:hypothetical protein
LPIDPVKKTEHCLWHKSLGVYDYTGVL